MVVLQHRPHVQTQSTGLLATLTAVLRDSNVRALSRVDVFNS